VPADSVLLQAGVLQELIRALAYTLASHSRESAAAADPAVAKPLLDLDETAELLGISRTTVAAWRTKDDSRRSLCAEDGYKRSAGFRERL
jgi:hypothetical protein